MQRRALLVCPGRGSYTADDLRSLDKWRAVPGRSALVDEIVGAADDYRRSVGSPTISELDQAERFSAARHAVGENAGPLIFTASAVDAFLLPRELYRPVAVVGNSMGWYTALFVGGALEFTESLRVVDTMSKTQRDGIVGGQIIYPVVDDEWRPDAALRDAALAAIGKVAAEGETAALSIDLGGFLVLAGSERGIQRLKETLGPRKFGKRDYPFQLINHAAFHTSLMQEHSDVGRRDLADLRWLAPTISMVDGTGRIWRPATTDAEAMRSYTFVTQCLETYDFTLSLRVALREFAPDVIVLLGPGDSLGGAIGQTLVREGWRGIGSKTEFLARQASDDPILLSLGRKDDFRRFVASRLA